jgi:hypothetical protein
MHSSLLASVEVVAYLNLDLTKVEYSIKGLTGDEKQNVKV